MFYSTCLCTVEIYYILKFFTIYVQLVNRDGLRERANVPGRGTFTTIMFINVYFLLLFDLLIEIFSSGLKQCLKQ